MNRGMQILIAFLVFVLLMAFGPLFVDDSGFYEPHFLEHFPEDYLGFSDIGSEVFFSGGNNTNSTNCSKIKVACFSSLPKNTYAAVDGSRCPLVIMMHPETAQNLNLVCGREYPISLLLSLFINYGDNDNEDNPIACVAQHEMVHVQQLLRGDRKTKKLCELEREAFLKQAGCEEKVYENSGCNEPANQNTIFCKSFLKSRFETVSLLALQNCLCEKDKVTDQSCKECLDAYFQRLRNVGMFSKDEKKRRAELCRSYCRDKWDDSFSNAKCALVNKPNLGVTKPPETQPVNPGDTPPPEPEEPQPEPTPGEGGGTPGGPQPN